MTKEAKEKTGRKKYEKPLLRVVNITDGIQALGVGCKLSNIDGDPNVMQPVGCGITNSCVSAAS
jgi:hypothetical protein